MPRRTTPDPETARLGARVRALRVERHMSLGDLADAAQVSKGHLSSIEHGLAAIRIPTILRLAQGLELRALYLLVSPTEDERDQVMELVRTLPSADIGKLRRELVKVNKELAKATRGPSKPPIR